jgi:tetratricopeptide (TPR) repeat protein
MSSSAPSSEARPVNGQRILLVGKLGGMSKRAAQQLLRSHGGVVVEKLDAAVELVVVGEDALLSDNSLVETLDEATRSAAERGAVEVIDETKLWQRLGLVEGDQDGRRLYTPGMLADLLGVKVAVIRRWHRLKLIVPKREVRRLPYFDFQEVATARRLAELLAAGMTPQAIERKLAALAKYLPHVDRPLAQLSVIVEGKQLLLRQGAGLIEPGGQLRFDFDGAATAEDAPAALQMSGAADALSRRRVVEGATEPVAATPTELMRLAGLLEDDGDLAGAADMVRAALAAGGPTADGCFFLAELLYQLNDLPAARERLFMALELDDGYVEARANLGCILVELGKHELAVAAFEGALSLHYDYPDAHYHLAATLDELGRLEQAEEHWQVFLQLAPESPWAAQAEHRLAAIRDGER